MSINQLSQNEWKAVNTRAKELAKEYAEGFSEDKYGKGEIHEDFEGRYEQREYGGSYFILQSELKDIIEEVLSDFGASSEALKGFDARLVDGFTELVIDFEGWVTDLLPNEWYVYYEDGDIWVARNWDEIDEVPEDLQHLVNEY